MDLTSLTITQASEMIQSGEIKPTDLLEAHLERIAKLEPKLEAWVTIDAEAARTSAKQADMEAQSGNIRSRLHGIPVGVKDIYYTKGLRTTMGSPIYKDFIPDRDSEIVAKLRRSGAIIIGKTETTEFAFLDPAPTRNPWEVNHTPGGSSAGSAAAVSACLAPLAFGSQTGGSITRPASFCGVVGVKPTYDLLSREGVYPLAWSMDHIGYITRNVADAKITLDTLTDTQTHDYEPGRPLHIGYVEGYFIDASDGEVATNYNEALQRLWRGENLLDPFELPKSFTVVHSAIRVIMFSESAAIHRKNFKTNIRDYRPNMRGMVASGLMIPSSTYLQAQRIRRVFIHDMLQAMKGYDLIVTPSAPTPALQGLESTGDAAFNSPWSFTGFPTITVPSGLTARGMPLGIQLIARHFDEPLLFSVASWVENKLGSIGNPPITL